CEYIVHHHSEPAGQILKPVDRIWFEDVERAEEREAHNHPPPPALTQSDHVRRDEDERNDLPANLINHNLTCVFTIKNLFGAMACPESERGGNNACCDQNVLQQQRVGAKKLYQPVGYQQPDD